MSEPAKNLFERLICEHNYVYLRSFTEEVTWHNFVDFDVFFCSKCLEQKKVEALKPIKRSY